MIGPRLTGSPGLAKANHWTRDKFRQYGLANAHLEPWMIERSWTRGEAKGRIVVPVEQRHPPGIGRLEPLDQGPAARAGGPRQGPVGRRAEPLQGQAQGGLGPARRGLGPALAQAGPRPTSKARCGAGCATSPGCASSAASCRSSWSPRASPALLRDSNKEHGLVNMTGAVRQLHPGRVPRGVPHHRVLRPDLAAAQARAGRGRDRPEEHLQRRARSRSTTRSPRSPAPRSPTRS